MIRIPDRVGRRRSGMTLIELLVVIAIIAILASLLTVGVIALWAKVLRRRIVTR